MAYRFLLEVPEELYEQANVVINHDPDGGIVDTHVGIAGDFDNPGITMTLMAHNLDIAWRLKDWYADVQANMPGARPVNYLLASGARLPVGESDPYDVVAAIRRDQPWVERTIPKIGEHITHTAPAGTLKPAVAQAAVAPARAAVVNAPRVANVTIIATDDPADHPNITVDGATMFHLPVIELFRAEQAYAEVFGLQLADRADSDGHGGYVWHNAQPGSTSDIRTNPEAGFAFLQNGALTVALDRYGRSAPISHHSNVPDPIKLMVSDESLENIKAEVLVRNWTVMDDSTPGIFVFRDSFGFTWEIHAQSYERDVRTNA